MTPILGIMASQISGHLSTAAYESIAKITPVATGSITFSSIPSTFKHLQIRCFSIPPTGNYTSLTVNSDTGNNYSFHQISGNGSTISTYSAASTNFMYIDSYSGTTSPSAAVIDILDYANTSKNKTVRCLSGCDSNGAGYIQIRSSVWLNTSAISSVTIASDGLYGAGSIFALYGIKG